MPTGEEGEIPRLHPPRRSAVGKKGRAATALPTEGKQEASERSFVPHGKEGEGEGAVGREIRCRRGKPRRQALPQGEGGGLARQGAGDVGIHRAVKGGGIPPLSEK